MDTYYDRAEADDRRRDAAADDYDRSPERITGYCTGCGAYVTSVTADMGYGRMEYWGHVFTHRDLCEVSPCCREEITEGEELEEATE